MSALDRDPFPRGALIAAGALVAVSLAVTATARLAGFTPLTAPKPTSAPEQWIDLRFVDEPDGSVRVKNGDDDRDVATLAPGTNGFVRGVVRGLAHERKVRGIGAAPPFRLAQWKGGRLVLLDTATGRRIDLDAFGVSNKDAFVQLLRGRSA